MSRQLLSLEDVLVQVTLTILLHWLIGGPWSGLGDRIAFTVPGALVMLWGWRFANAPAATS